MSYSRFIAGLRKSGVALDRKLLSDIAHNDRPTFDKLVEIAKKVA
jgi:large subunit ribosomal protein L20